MKTFYKEKGVNKTVFLHEVGDASCSSLIHFSQ